MELISSFIKDQINSVLFTFIVSVLKVASHFIQNINFQIEKHGYLYKFSSGVGFKRAFK